MATTERATRLDDGQIKKTFNSFDSNGNGILSLAEIDKAVLELYPQFSKNKKVLMRAYKAADISKDGFINLSEFNRLIELFYYYNDLYEIFQKLDQNKDNRISFAEFKKGHKLVGFEGGTPTELKKEYDSIDTNRTGYILFDELCFYIAKKKLVEETQPISREVPQPPPSVTETAISDDATSLLSDARSLVDTIRDDVVIKSLYKLSEDLVGFLNKSEGCDVKIEIGKESEIEEFSAHSHILRARSAYFSTALSKDSNKTEGDGTTVSYIYSALSTFMSQTSDSEEDTIIFKKENVSPKIFKIILSYVYGGAAGITKINELASTEFMDLLEASEELGIQGFGDYLQPYFLENHYEWIRDNLLTVERFASKRDAFREIQNYALDQLCQNPDVILKSGDKKSIDKSVLLSFLSRDDLIADESALWTFILEWGFAQDPKFKELSENKTIEFYEWPAEEIKKLKGFVDGLTSLIRFKWIPSDFFFTSVRPYKPVFDSDAYEEIMQFYFTGSSPTSPVRTSFPISQDIKARDKDANLIINENRNYAVLISCWIDRKQFKLDHKPYKFKLLYRGSSENFSYSAFHEKCDTTQNTLTIAKIKGTGELVGGYNPRTWKIAGRSSNSTYPIQSRRTFIFKIDKSNLENSKLSRVNDQYNALRHKKDSGPNFCDLEILNQTAPIRYDHRFYEKDLNIKDPQNLEDYEVYKVLK